MNDDKGENGKNFKIRINVEEIGSSPVNDLGDHQCWSLGWLGDGVFLGYKHFNSFPKWNSMI